MYVCDVPTVFPGGTGNAKTEEYLLQTPTILSSSISTQGPSLGIIDKSYALSTINHARDLSDKPISGIKIAGIRKLSVELSKELGDFTCYLLSAQQRGPGRPITTSGLLVSNLPTRFDLSYQRYDGGVSGDGVRLRYELPDAQTEFADQFTRATQDIAIFRRNIDDVIAKLEMKGKRGRRHV